MRKKGKRSTRKGNFNRLLGMPLLKRKGGGGNNRPKIDIVSILYNNEFIFTFRDSIGFQKALAFKPDLSRGHILSLPFPA